MYLRLADGRDAVVDSVHLVLIQGIVVDAHILHLTTESGVTVEETTTDVVDDGLHVGRTDADGVSAGFYLSVNVDA